MTHKYRGLTEECRWAYGHYCKVEGKHYIILDDAELFPSNFDDPIYLNGEVIYGFIRVFPETVGQYIGRKDKNKVEIYGGDIVSEDPDGGNSTVEWNEFTGAWVIVQNDVCLYPSLEKDGYKWTDLEVIGNIHQNPELKEN